MQQEEVVQLVKKIQGMKTEWQTVEVKAAHGGFPKLYDTLSSFSNQDDGGVIILGVDEASSYKVVGVYDASDAQKKLMEACGQMEPPVRALITVAEVDGMNVVTAEVPGVEFANRPVYYRGTGRLKGSYVRVGDADEHMNEFEVYSYEAFRKRIHDELRTVDRASMEMLDASQLQKYIRSVKKARKNLAENVSDDWILKLMGIKESDEPTLAGVMCFSPYPQAYFPQLCITAVVVPGTKIGDMGDEDERFIDNERITGSISDMVESGVEFVRRNSRTKTIIDHDGKRNDKTEYPIKAVREAILNMMIHRDYSMYTENIPSSIEMYRDRIVFRNPGGLFGAASVELLGRVRPETRNPVLANIMEIMNVTENRYSGIPTIFNELEAAGLGRPEFKVAHGEFSLTFYNDYFSLKDTIDKSDMERAIVQFCKTPRSRKEIIDFVGKSSYYVMSRYVNPMVESGKLARSLPEKPKSSKQKFYSK